MQPLRSLHLRLVYFYSAFLIAGCSDDQKPDVPPQDPYYQQFISGYTTGLIRSGAGISILFAKAPELKTDALEELITLSPRSSFKVSRPDDRSLLITPKDKWEPGTAYLLSLELSSLFKVEEQKFKRFQFTFQTIAQQMEVQRSGLMLLPDGSGYELQGKLLFADEVGHTLPDDLLTAKVKGERIPIRISGALTLEKQFVVGPIPVSNEGGNLKIYFSGKTIGAAQEGSLEVELPVASRFTVLEHMVQENPAQVVELYFSQAIDPGQSMDGLINIEGVPGCRYELNANKCLIFPPVRQSGTFNLNVHPNLRSRSGKSLERAYQSQVIFESLKPALRSVGEGVILPSSSRWVVPFEAISLKSVQLTVLKVYERNMGFFLQTNELDGRSEFRRVGRPVLRKTIALSSLGAFESSRWTRFSLDLSDLVKQEQGALYQVYLSYGRNDILFPCTGNTIEETSDERFDPDAYSPEYDSPYGYEEDYMDYYNDPEYDWNQRDNPCNPAYYDWQRALTKNLLVSNLGLMAKRGTGNEMLVFATDLNTASPIAGVEISLLDFQLQPLAEGKTDAEGKVTLEGKRRPFLVLASKDKERAYLKVEEGSALSTSTFDVAGANVQKSMKGYLYGERGIWRPGDTVFVSFMLYATQIKLPEEHPVKLEWRDPAGVKRYEQTTLSGIAGIYHFPVPTAKIDPTGFYTAKVRVGGAVFEKKFQLETIKPNRINIEFEPGEVWQLQKGPLKVPLKARWYNGGKTAGFKASYELNLSPVKTVFKGFEKFEFDPLGIEASTRSMPVFEGFLDQNGTAAVHVSAPADQLSFPTYKAQFTGKVFEPGGDFSIDAVSIPCRTYLSYVGILRPEAKGWAGFLSAGKNHRIQLAHVTADGSKASGKLQVKVHKLDWRWWWEDYDERFQYEQLSYKRAVFEDEIESSGGYGSFDFYVQQQEWGRYMVQVTDPVSGHFSSIILYFDWPEGRVNDGSSRSGVEYLSLSADQKLYAPGEEGTILFESAIEGMALLTLENGSKVVHSQWHKAKAGKNELKVSIEPGSAPGLYACVTLILPHEAAQSGQPIRRYGYLYLPVEDPAKRLKPELICAGEIKPGQKLSIKIKEKNNQAMAYTLAIVDEGLLSLNRFKTPDPYAAFYAREALGVSSWDVFPYVVGAYAGQFGRLLSVGGDSELPAMPPDTERHLKSWVHFSGPFFLKSGQIAEQQIQVPSFNGEARIMLIAGYNGSYGHIEQKLKVTQPLSMLVSLPRGIAQGEEVLIPVNVFNQRKEIRNIRVSLKTEGTIQTLSPPAVNLSVAGQSSSVAFLKVRATKPGVGRLQFDASSPGDQVSEKYTLEVTDRSPELNYRMERQLVDNEEWIIKVAELPLTQIKDLHLQASVFQLPNLQGRINELLQYPHGCLEQTVSTAFPLLYLPTLTSLSKKAEEDRQYYLNIALRKLEQFQNSAGELSYWPGASTYHEWSSLYAGHFMIEASAAGLAVSGNLLKNWLASQSQKATNWKVGKGYTVDIQSYRLMLLSLAGRPVLTAQNQLYEQHKLSGDQSLMMAAAYALSGNQSTAQKLLAVQANPADEGEEEHWQVLYSSSRSKALRLYNLVLLKQLPEAEKLAVELSKALSTDTRYNTHETAWMLMSIMKYLGESKQRNSAKCSFELTQNSKRQSVTTDLPSATLKLDEKSTEWRIKNNTGARLFLDFNYLGKPKTEVQMAKVSKGLSLDFKIISNTDGSVVDLTKIKPGDELLLLATITNTQSERKSEQIAFTLPVPGGFELRNDRLLGQEQGVEHIDFRDQEVRYYFSLLSGRSRSIRQRVTVTHQGRFFWPAVVAESMYSPGVYALEPSHWVQPLNPIP